MSKWSLRSLALTQLASLHRRNRGLFRRDQGLLWGSVSYPPPKGSFQDKYWHSGLPRALHSHLMIATQSASASGPSMSRRRRARWEHFAWSSLPRSPSYTLYFQLPRASQRTLCSHHQYLYETCQALELNLLDFMSSKAQTSLIFDFFCSTALSSVVWEL